MSSIRLFILSSFATFGPMHGHLLRMEAERKQVPLWTDISVGAVYGAMKRLATEGLLREVGTESVGNRPARQLYEITDEGRNALAELRSNGLTEIWFMYDPFDLALTLVEPDGVDDLPSIIIARLAQAQKMLEDRRQLTMEVQPLISLADQWALRHSVSRLEAEVAYLQELAAATVDIVADQKQRQLGSKPPPASPSATTTKPKRS
jgi:DNA-binding PadR family transcriptional regulator